MQHALVPRSAGRLFRALVVIAVLLGSLASPAGASTAAQWSKAYCNSLDALNAASTDAFDAMRPLDPVRQLPQLLVVVRTGLTEVQSVSTDAVTALKKAGKPKVKQGAKVQAQAVAAFEEAAQVATGALAGLDRGDLAGQTAAISAVVGVRGPVNDFHSTVLEQALTKDKKFAKAFGKVCT